MNRIVDLLTRTTIRQTGNRRRRGRFFQVLKIAGESFGEPIAQG